ncbi:ABC transporter ATP-binding protein [Brucella pituitosa]|nr:ABC transporter ATP-binding protein [Brucella pituitosa]
MSRMGAQVEITNLVKRYGSNVTAVDNANFKVDAGEFLSVLGPSGSGKTSILMCLAGFEVPTSGTIDIGGRDVTALPPNKREIGVIFQRYALFPHMSVRENVRFPLKMRSMAKAESDAVVEEALATVRLSGLADRMPDQLSGGQQQRVAIARAIAFRPPLLLMDEPLSALDKKLREEMQIEIKELQRKLGLTIIFVTHDQEEALTMSDRIAVMTHGRIEQIAAPDMLYREPTTRFVAGFVGETSCLPGTVKQNSAGSVLVALDGGGDVQAILPSGNSVNEGSAVEIFVRPEHIIASSNASPGTFEASIVSKSFTGASIVVTSRTKANVRITARLGLDAAANIPSDGTVFLAVQPGRATCFLKEGATQ